MQVHDDSESFRDNSLWADAGGSPKPIRGSFNGLSAVGSASFSAQNTTSHRLLFAVSPGSPIPPVPADAGSDRGE